MSFLPLMQKGNLDAAHPSADIELDSCLLRSDLWSGERK
jgi:hypothetical protein